MRKENILNLLHNTIKHLERWGQIRSADKVDVVFLGRFRPWKTGEREEEAVMLIPLF
jgi:hypothetical protein